MGVSQQGFHLRVMAVEPPFLCNTLWTARRVGLSSVAMMTCVTVKHSWQILFGEVCVLNLSSCPTTTSVEGHHSGLIGWQEVCGKGAGWHFPTIASLMLMHPATWRHLHALGLLNWWSTPPWVQLVPETGRQLFGYKVEEAILACYGMGANPHPLCPHPCCGPAPARHAPQDFESWPARRSSSRSRPLLTHLFCQFPCCFLFIYVVFNYLMHVFVVYMCMPVCVVFMTLLREKRNKLSEGPKHLNTLMRILYEE